MLHPKLIIICLFSIIMLNAQDIQTYGQEIIIDNSTNSETLDDYQVMLTLTPSNFDYSNASSDGRDIWIRDDENQQLLPYWIKEWNSDSTSKIYIKIPQITANGISKVFFLYGDSTRNNNSNGYAVFDFFDDFENTELDTSKWNILYNNGTLELSEGYLKASRPKGGNAIDICSKDSLTGYKIIEFKKRIIQPNYYYSSIYYGADSTFSSIGYSLYPQYESALFTGNGRNAQRCGSEPSNEGDIITDPPVNDWFNEILISSAGNLRRVLNGEIDEEAIRYQGTVAGRIGMHWSSAASYSMESHTDYILVRKFADTEPTISLGSVTAVHERELKEPVYPEQVVLHQNYPNPFNPLTTIEYELPTASQMDLSIYSIHGQKVATLVSEKQPAGIHKVEWDASKFSSGVYFYKLLTDIEYAQTKKLVLVR